MEELDKTSIIKEETQKCTNCKVSRNLSHFVGKAGDYVKRCIKCREKDKRQKQKPDIMEKNRARQNEKKYYIKHRENKRFENEEAYLQHNAAMAKKWRDNNQAHVKEWRTQNFGYRFKGIKQQAHKKGIPWNADLTDEICYQLMTSKCFYCDFLTDKTLNGIDRMDSAGNYEKSNTVSCCKNCNFMKGSLDPVTFIKRCHHISKHFGGNGGEYADIWPNKRCSTTYSGYLVRANKKEYEFSITKEQFDAFTNNNCYYCGKECNQMHTNGVDRKNNNVGYVLDNCVGCCSECNYMKGSLDDNEFVEQCKTIADFITFENSKIQNIATCINRITKRI